MEWGKNMYIQQQHFFTQVLVPFVKNNFERLDKLKTRTTDAAIFWDVWYEWNGGKYIHTGSSFLLKFWSRLIKKRCWKKGPWVLPFSDWETFRTRLKCVAKVLTKSQAKLLLLYIGKEGTNMALSYLDATRGDCEPGSFMVLGVAIRHLKSSGVGAFTWSSLRWFQLVVVRKKERVLVLVGTWMRHLKRSGVQGCLSVCDVLYCKV